MKINIRKYRSYALVLATALLVSCTAVQIEKTKKIAKISAGLTIASLPLIANVTTAYGAGYAGVVAAFAESLVPGYVAPEARRDDDDYDDENYDDEEYDDEEYDDEEYDDEYENDEYDEQDYDEQDYDEDRESDVSDFMGRDQTMAMEQFDSSNLEDDALNVQVNVLRESNSRVRRGIPIRNGDRLTEDDNYKVQLRCSIECYAYIAQLDATGRMDPIFPSAFVDEQNPLFANQSYSIPSADDWFYLDSNIGIEQIYFIFSRTPRDDIDLIFEQLSQANENLVQKKAISIEEPLVLTKGIAGVRKGNRESITLSNGAEGQYVSTVLQSIEAEMVITKWFRHE